MNKDKMLEEKAIEEYRKQLAEIFKNVTIKDQEEMTEEELKESFKE